MLQSIPETENQCDLARHGYKAHYNQRCRHVVLRYCIATFGIRHVLATFREMDPHKTKKEDLQYLTALAARPSSASPFTFRNHIPTYL